MKLPINPLLHLISLGAVGGMVVSALHVKDNMAIYTALHKQVKKDVNTLRDRAKNSRSGRGGWNYHDERFWDLLQDVNFTGKVKVEDQPKVKDPEADKPKIAGDIDLNDVLHVIAITYGEGLNGVVVSYTATVEVPLKFQMGVAANVINATIPVGRRKRSNSRPRIPVRRSASSPPHHLKTGDHLWPPYEHVFLHSINSDASEVEFELRIAPAGSDPKKKNPVQTLLKNQLGLPVEILKSLLAGSSTGKAGSSRSRTDKASDPSNGYKWIDQPTTFVDRRGNVNISNKDSKWLRRDGAQIFNEDVHMRDYSAGSGSHKVRGIQLRKLSPRVRQFGAREGDVVISINNEKVKGMASAKRLGRRLYNRGVRSFRIEILRRGERQILRYHMKKGQ